MDTYKIIFNNLLTTAKENPKTTIFLAAIAFLAFSLHCALFIANQGLWVFCIYVVLALCAFVVLVLLMFLTAKQSKLQ